jgi:hypothetical protein
MFSNDTPAHALWVLGFILFDLVVTALVLAVVFS